jgi:hypothetical protein
MKATAMALVVTLMLLAGTANAGTWPTPGTIVPCDTGYIEYTANGFKFPMSVVMSGMPSPNASTATGWMVADFEGGITSDPGTVTLTLTARNLSVSSSDPSLAEYVDEWLFNIDPSVVLTSLVVTPWVLDGAVSTPQISLGTDQYSIPGTKTGLYDMKVAFNTSAGRDVRFDAGDAIQLTITGGQNLTAEAFLSQSTITSDELCFHTIATMGNVGPEFDSESVVTPEPATLSLLGLGSLIAVRMRKRRA